MLNVIVTFDDITERRQAEDALQKAHDELEHRVVKRTEELGNALAVLKTEIDDRKRIEQELRDSEERFQSLSNASFEGILLTEQGRIVEVNDNVINPCGYQKSELLNMVATDLISVEERENVKSKMLSGYELPNLGQVV